MEQDREFPFIFSHPNPSTQLYLTPTIINIMH